MQNILIMSASPDRHKDLIQYLRDCRYNISVAGADSIFQVIDENDQIDVILIERNFPYLDILRFLKRLRSNQSTACVLLIGPPLDAGKLAVLFRAGVFDYLKIPFSPKSLEKTIRKGLKNREDLIKILELSNHLQLANQTLAGERDRLKKWNEDLSLLHQLNQNLSQSLHTEEVIRLSMENIKKIVAYDIACLYLEKLDQTRIEVNHDQLECFADSFSEKTLQQGRIFMESNQAAAGPVVSKGGYEIMIPLAIGKEKIGLLRLVRVRKAENGRPDALEPYNHYQSKMLSMISTPLTLALRNAEMYQQVQDLAVRDELTGTLNRRAFSKTLEREFRRAKRYDTPLSLILVDIDYFKEINDTHGHLVGDQVLKKMVSVLNNSIREVDILARYGGDEFVSLLPGTNLEEVLVVARRMKEQVQTTYFHRNGNPIEVTVSIGVAHYPLPEITSPDLLFELADQALYRAKRNGRNQTMMPSMSSLSAGALTMSQGSGFKHASRAQSPSL